MQVHMNSNGMLHTCGAAVVQYMHVHCTNSRFLARHCVILLNMHKFIRDNIFYGNRNNNINMNRSDL